VRARVATFGRYKGLMPASSGPAACMGALFQRARSGPGPRGVEPGCLSGAFVARAGSRHRRPSLADCSPSRDLLQGRHARQLRRGFRTWLVEQTAARGRRDGRRAWRSNGSPRLPCGGRAGAGCGHRRRSTQLARFASGGGLRADGGHRADRSRARSRARRPTPGARSGRGRPRPWQHLPA